MANPLPAGGGVDARPCCLPAAVLMNKEGLPAGGGGLVEKVHGTN